MSPFAKELCERSKRDDDMIVGSEARGLCMEIIVNERERDEARAQAAKLAALLRSVRPYIDHADSQFIDYPAGLNEDIDAALAEYEDGKPNPSDQRAGEEIRHGK